MRAPLVKLIPIPGMWWLLAKMAAVAMSGGLLFGIAVALMAAFQMGMGPHVIVAGTNAAIISGAVLLVLGLIWVFLRWRSASLEQRAGDLQ